MIHADQVRTVLEGYVSSGEIERETAAMIANDLGVTDFVLDFEGVVELDAQSFGFEFKAKQKPTFTDDDWAELNRRLGQTLINFMEEKGVLVTDVCPPGVTAINIEDD